MIRVPEEHAKAKRRSVGSAGKRGLECRNGAGSEAWVGGVVTGKRGLKRRDCAGKRGLESRKDS